MQSINHLSAASAKKTGAVTVAELRTMGTKAKAKAKEEGGREREGERVRTYTGENRRELTGGRATTGGAERNLLLPPAMH